MAEKLEQSIIDSLVKNSSKITSREDLLVACIHGLLISRGYELDHPTGTESQRQEQGSLPTEWNAGQDVYELNYKHRSKEYLLKALKVDGLISFYFLDPNSEEMKDVTVTVNEHISPDIECIESLATASEFKRAISNFSKLIEDTMTIDHSCTPQKSTSTTSTQNAAVDGGSLKSERTKGESSLLIDEFQHNPRRYDPFAYGQSDLYPGGIGGSGGMLFDPFRSGGGYGGPSFGAGPRQPGRIPGARFDPIGPFPGAGFGYQPRGPRFPRDPDADHMRPPGFEDDMFM